MSREEIERKVEQFYVLKAMLIAPLAAIIGTILGGAISGEWVHAEHESLFRSVVSYIGGFVVFVLPVSYVSTFMFGYPVFWLLRKTKQLNWWSFLIAGAVLGVSICLLFLGAERTLVSLFSFSGASVGLLAWWVYTHRDRRYAL
jgi:hypothetical protein